MAKSKTKKPVPRNSSALAAKSRKAGMAPMKSRNEPRGGNRNEQRELLEEAEEEKDFLATEKTGFDSWVKKQIENPEFKRYLDYMIEQIKKSSGKNND